MPKHMDSSGATSWWVTIGEQEPLGPVSPEQLAARIRSGEIPENAFVCEVGGNAWVALTDVAELEAVVRELGRDAFNDPQEHTVVGRPRFDSFDPATGETDAGEDDLPTIRPMAPPDDQE